MTITKRDLEVVAAVYHQAELPVPQLAAQIGQREHTLRYSLNKLVSEGYLSPQPFVDVYTLGCLQVEMFVNLASRRHVDVRLFLETLKRMPQVAWIGSFGGDYQYGFTVVVRSISELPEFMRILAAKAGNLIYEKQLSIRQRYTEFPLKQFSEKQFGPRELWFGFSESRYEADDLDLKIVSMLCHQAISSRREMSRQLGLSVTALQNRVARLERANVIRGYSYVVNFQKLGYEGFLLLISLKGLDMDTRQRFYDFSRRHRRIIYLVESVGTWDLGLGFIVRKSQESTGVIQEVYEQFPSQIAQLKTLAVFDYPKVARYPF